MAENKCTLSNEDLLQQCEQWVHKLAKSGGKDWCLQVPVNFNKDPDMLFMELINRFNAQQGSISNNSVQYELRLALYDMIKTTRALIENRGTILNARKRIEAAEGILKKHFKITDILRDESTQSAPNEIIAALQAFVSRHEAGLLPDRFVYEQAKKALEG